MNIRDLQLEIFEILKVFRDTCDNNELAYFLFYGTLLGAVRHKGFIPWDDDIDIAMPRKDYEKFIELYKNHFTDDFYLDGYNCKRYESYSPVVRINSRRISIRRDKNNTEHWIGAFISIFPIDGLPYNKFVKSFHIKHTLFCYGILRASRSSLFGLGNVERRTKSEKLFILSNKIFKIGRIIPPEFASKHYNMCVSKYDIGCSSEVYIAYEGKKSVFQKKDFYDYCLLDFEGEKFRVPIGYKNILRQCYGNYMTMPPKEERKPQHSIQIKLN